MLRRTPLNRKRPTPRRVGPPAPRIKPEREEDPEHLAFVRRCPCFLCMKLGLRQDSHTEAHHIRRKPDGSTYGTSQKAPDRDTLPLCAGRHHWNGVHCQSKLSHRRFEAEYGNELDLLEEFRWWVFKGGAVFYTLSAQGPDTLSTTTPAQTDELER